MKSKTANNALKLTSLASPGGLASQLNAVLVGLQAAHPGSLVAGLETESTGRDGPRWPRSRACRGRRDTEPVPAALIQFRRVTAPAMSLCTRRATPRRLSPNRRRDETDSPSVVLAAGSKGHLAKASSGPPERRARHRRTTPTNNALKLTAHGGGPVGCGAPQLNAVFDGP